MGAVQSPGDDHIFPTALVVIPEQVVKGDCGLENPQKLFHGIAVPNAIPQSQSHRVVWIERDFRDDPVPPPLPWARMSPQKRMLRPPSTLASQWRNIHAGKQNLTDQKAFEHYCQIWIMWANFACGSKGTVAQPAGEQIQWVGLNQTLYQHMISKSKWSCPSGDVSFHNNLFFSRGGTNGIEPRRHSKGILSLIPIFLLMASSGDTKSQSLRSPNPTARLKSSTAQSVLSEIYSLPRRNK